MSVEQRASTRDEITRVSGVSHGVLTTDQAHLQKRVYAFTNRMGEKTTVYVKHTVTPGYKLPVNGVDWTMTGGIACERRKHQA